jgi:VCBS repeat-containing protein
VPSNGVLKLNGAALSSNDTFTQDDIDQNRVTYTHGGGETASDLFKFGVSDGTGGSIPETTFNITITPVNDAPTLAANAGLTVNEGGSGAITTAALQATDPDTGAAQLTYTLTAAPSKGTLSLNGAPLAVSGTFTQDDIDQGRVTYAHDGSETTGDAFTFSVGDGSGGSIGATSFNVTVNPANDAPVLAVNTGVTVNEGATTTVTTAMLRTTDVDNTAAELRYTLTTAPANGSLRLNGTALAANGTFTQDDIDQGRVTYVHGGSETTSDGFTVTIGDGAGGSIGPTAFAIGVNLQNDNPFLARSVAPSVDEGGTIRITSSFLLAADSETASSQLTYSLSSVPSSGVLKLNGVTLRPGDTFTQDDIDNDRVTYTHDGSNTTDDAFSFVISDTSGGTSPTSALFITVTPLAAPPPPPSPRDAPNEPGPGGGGGPPVVRPQPPVSAPEPPPELPRNDPIPTPPSSGGPDSFVDVPRGHGPSVPIDVPGDTIDGRAPAFVPSRSTPALKAVATLQGAPIQATPTGIPELFLPLDGELSRKLDSMKEEMRPRGELDRLVAGSASAVGIGLSVGYLVWTARAGYLLSMLLASLPAWTPVDPLPILDHADDEKDDEDPEDEETLESMLAGSDPQP